MTLDFQQTRDLLYNFQFEDLFIQQLAWSQSSRRKAVELEIEEKTYQCKTIAESSGVAVFEVTAADGAIPEAKIRAAIHQEIAKFKAENLLIFIDEKRTRSLWYWVKREGNKNFIRDHYYVKGQPGDLFISKLASLLFSISELENGEPSVIAVINKLKEGLDVETITKKFYKEFEKLHSKFITYVQGINNKNDRRWYTSVILNRLMFVYFLQHKGFLDNSDRNYLRNQLTRSKKRGDNLFYKEFLYALFFKSFAKPEPHDIEVIELVGNIKYLNGGLFLEHPIERNYKISIDDEAFEEVLNLFENYSWHLNDTPGGNDSEINPDVLGHIFEKYINQKAFGAYYTRPEITEYLCDRTIDKLIVDRVNAALCSPPFSTLGRYKPFADIKELMTFKLDANLCHLLIDEEKGILPNLSILDPACGSGAFLLAAMKKLFNIYFAVIGAIERDGDYKVKKWLTDLKSSGDSLPYSIKKRIITNNLYGVDIMEEATEIARLRLFLGLVASAENINELKPLPNIDFNIMVGNSLIGLMQVKASVYDSRLGQQELFNKTYNQLLEEKNKLIKQYRDSNCDSKNLEGLREKINAKRKDAKSNLDAILWEEFKYLKIKYEEAKLTGKSKKCSLELKRIKDLKAFHWGYEFDEILQNHKNHNLQSGFDAIITNPPWEIFKPQAKEFFAQHNELVTKNKMDIKAFEKEQKKLLQNPEIAEAWLEYQNQYPYVSAYYRSSEEYKNQISVVNGKKAGTDINLYKLFLERCFNLLRTGGECGIVIPSGIYTDLGSKQLREMLFSQSKVTGLFCLENREAIFEGVDSRFKIVVLSFEKGGVTTEFPSAFMRLDVQELERFPNQDSLPISVDMVRRLSPDSLSVMEFKNEVDVRIAEKMLKFPLLGDKIEGKWNFVLNREFDRGNDNNIFQVIHAENSLPLFVGKMFHQFTLTKEISPFWITESVGRKILIGKEQDDNQVLDYQNYRWVHRRIARNTDSRTLITTIAPYKVFCDNNSTTIDLSKSGISNIEMIFLCGVCNSFVVDWLLRQKVTTTLNMFYIYQLAVPRLTESDKYFNEIVERAAKLICTTPEYDELAQEVGLESHTNGVTDESERAKLRAELDGMIAHLYGLTESEFEYILTTFPIVKEQVKQDVG
jgi:hypothetical protein